MLLFEDEPDKSQEEHPVKSVSVYLDPEHIRMLDLLCDRGNIGRSDAIRQCIRLGYKTILSTPSMTVKFKDGVDPEK